MTEGRLLSTEELERLNALARDLEKFSALPGNTILAGDRELIIKAADAVAALSRPAKDVEGLILRLENSAAFYTKIAASHETIDAESAADEAALYSEGAAALTALARERDAVEKAHAANNQALDRSHREHRLLRNVLAELVRIKDRKDAEGPYTGYDREKNAAWAAARACLSSDRAQEDS